MKKIIKIENGLKSFKLNENKIVALNNVSIEFEKGKIYLIYGHSGSGKSTLIQIIGLLDKLDKGNLYLYDKETNKMTSKEKAKMRMNNIGFVFQSYFLNKNLNAIDNVMMPMFINSKIKKNDRKNRAIELLKIVGLEDRLNHYPKELSGGEQQRVAIARALANDPSIILADEPTGNLDRKNEIKVIQIFNELKKLGKCVIVVTHSEELKKYGDVIFEMENGNIYERNNVNEKK